MRQIEQAHSTQDQIIIFVALELSKSAWLLASQSPPRGKTSSHRLAGGDRPRRTSGRGAVDTDFRRSRLDRRGV